MLGYTRGEARKLAADAGYGKSMKARPSINTGGTKQMVNEALQEMLHLCRNHLTLYVDRLLLD